MSGILLLLLLVLSWSLRSGSTVLQDSLDRDLLDRDSLDRDLLDRDSLDRDSLDRDSLDRDSLDRDLLDRDSLDRDLLDRDLLDRDLLDRDLLDRDLLDPGPVSLNDMFREVEELMEDTQHLLDEAVEQITTESAKSSSSSLDLLQNFHNQSRKVIKDGNRTVQVLDRTDQETNNGTGETRLSHVHMEVSGQWNSINHDCMVDEDCGDLKYCLYEIQSSKCLPCIPTDMDCMVDEDCGDLKYCLYEIQSSKCLPCIPTDMPCTKDEECCSEQLCVWGQCSVNTTRGTEGTICQSQRDCRTELCCAFQRELLFPVCNPKPGRGDSCLNHPNLLMDLLAWNQDQPGDHCPCSEGLQCQPHGRGSVCSD